MRSILPVLLLLAISDVGVVAQNLSDAWHLDDLYHLVNERIDPIVSPNAVGGHMHRVLGGNMFGASFNGPQALQSTCTTAAIQKDLSNYWMPQLYWMENNTFTPITAVHRFYYFLGRNQPNQPVTAFPTGLRMLIGNPNAKTLAAGGLTSQTAVFTCQKNHYVTPNEDYIGPDFNFATDCPNGMKTEMRFPPCWDGVNLWKSDMSHMSYASNVLYGECPYSHPIRLPGIMLEFTWRTDLLRPGVPLANKLVWSCGDTTGYGIHADFTAAWDETVLNKALNDPTCVGLGHEIDMTQCATLAQYMNDATASGCTPSRGVYNETYNVADGVAIPALPGCNQPWSAGTKPSCSGFTNAPLPASLTGTDGSYTVANSSQYLATYNQNIAASNGYSNGAVSSSAFTPAATMATSAYNNASWSYLGCFGDSSTVRTLNIGANYSDSGLTVPKCEEYCYEWGFPYAGVESGVYCMCGNSFNSSQYMASACSSKCGGDSSTTCGGNGIVDIYYNPTITGKPTLNPDPQYIGCRHEAPNGLKTLPSAYIATGSMTIEWCKSYCTSQGYTIAGIEFGHSCMCANSFQNGGGYALPEYDCNSPCNGNSAEMCGGPNFGLSTFNLTIPAGASSAKVNTTSTNSTSSSVSSSASASASSALASVKASGSSPAALVAASASSSSVVVASSSTSKPASSSSAPASSSSAPSSSSGSCGAAVTVTVTKTTTVSSSSASSSSAAPSSSAPHKRGSEGQAEAGRVKEMAKKRRKSSRDFFGYH